MTAVMVSTRSAHWASKLPDWIQVKAGATSGSAWPVRKPMKIGQLIAQEEKSAPVVTILAGSRSEEHTSELQSLMRISYAVFCLKKKKKTQKQKEYSKNHDK